MNILSKSVGLVRVSFQKSIVWESITYEASSDGVLVRYRFDVSFPHQSESATVISYRIIQAKNHIKVWHSFFNAELI
jgi:hypothetical protein